MEEERVPKEIRKRQKLLKKIQAVKEELRRIEEEGGRDDPYDKRHFIYDPARDVYICPEGKEVKFYKERRDLYHIGFTRRQRKVQKEVVVDRICVWSF